LKASLKEEICLGGIKKKRQTCVMQNPLYFIILILIALCTCYYSFWAKAKNCTFV